MLYQNGIIIEDLRLARRKYCRKEGSEYGQEKKREIAKSVRGVRGWDVLQVSTSCVNRVYKRSGRGPTWTRVVLFQDCLSSTTTNRLAKEGV